MQQRMNKLYHVIFRTRLALCLFCLNAAPHVLQSENAPKFKGKYLGQKKPGIKAVKFIEGMLTGDKNSFIVSFSPDMKVLFFPHNRGNSERPYPEYEIRHFIQVDGKQLFFTSDRLHPKTADMDIYYTENSYFSNAAKEKTEGFIGSAP
jgi:hypothetical protein